MCSARRLMVFNICVKFHENMSSGFKVMERTRKLLTDTHTHTHTHTQKRRKHYTPIAYFVCLGYNKGLQFVSHILILKGIWAFICYLYFTSHLTFKQKLCHYCQQKKGQHQNKFFLAFNIKETQWNKSLYKWKPLYNFINSYALKDEQATSPLYSNQDNWITSMYIFCFYTGKQILWFPVCLPQQCRSS